jgi:hypothetical protein
VIILDTLVIGGIKFVLRRIAEAVDAEINDVDVLREELLAAQMRRELGEIDDAEFAEIERELLARMRELHASATDAEPGAMRVTGIEIDVADELGDDAADGPGKR